MNKILYLCIFLILINCCGCLSSKPKDPIKYDGITYDSIIIIKITSRNNINDSIINKIRNDLEAIGINTNNSKSDYIITVKFDNKNLSRNHLGGGIEYNYKRWIDSNHWRYSYDKNNNNSFIFKYNLSLENSIIIDNCYIAEWPAKYQGSSISSNECENILHSYNDKIVRIVNNNIKGDIIFTLYQERQPPITKP